MTVIWLYLKPNLHRAIFGRQRPKFWPLVENSFLLPATALELVIALWRFGFMSGFSCISWEFTCISWGFYLYVKSNFICTLWLVLTIIYVTLAIFFGWLPILYAWFTQSFIGGYIIIYSPESFSNIFLVDSWQSRQHWWWW